MDFIYEVWRGESEITSVRIHEYDHEKNEYTANISLTSIYGNYWKQNSCINYKGLQWMTYVVPWCVVRIAFFDAPILEWSSRITCILNNKRYQTEWKNETRNCNSYLSEFIESYRVIKLEVLGFVWIDVEHFYITLFCFYNTSTVLFFLAVSEGPY